MFVSNIIFKKRDQFSEQKRLLNFPTAVTVAPDFTATNGPCNSSSSTVHREGGIFEMSLALLFRPLDSYCIHVDRKAPDLVQEAVRGIVESYQAAFPRANIFMAKAPEKLATSQRWSFLQIFPSFSE